MPPHSSHRDTFALPRNTRRRPHQRGATCADVIALVAVVVAVACCDALVAARLRPCVTARVYPTTTERARLFLRNRPKK